MKMKFVNVFLLILMLFSFANMAEAQKKSTKRTSKTKTSTDVVATPPPADSTPVAAAAKSDSLPLKKTKKSLRPDEAVETSVLRERTPLPYEHIRADDAVYRQRIWRELDTREKQNLPFMYSADADNGNQRFISIILEAIQDSTKGITAFATIDDRFTTPMTISEIAKAVVGEEVDVPDYDSAGNLIGTKKKRNDINLDSFYRFHIKEEVIFDKESSRLFWRILGIAPVKNIVTTQGVDLGPTELFWIYYPDMRPIFASYEVYNGKNFGSRMSWEELFESRMFSSRIIKSSIDNPRDMQIKDIPGFKENSILQLMEGENIKEKIFNYEQDLWEY